MRPIMAFIKHDHCMSSGMCEASTIWQYGGMRIVSENSPAELDRRRLTPVVNQRIREMTANLLRVMRGAGKAYEIPGQVQDVINGLVDFQEALGRLPSDYDLTTALSTGYDTEVLSRFSPENLEEIRIEAKIVRGALQIAASRLLGQLTHERAGENEMFEGIREMDLFRAEQRKAREAASRTHAAKSSRKPRRLKTPSKQT